MAAEPHLMENIILLDDPDLFLELAGLMTSPDALQALGCSVSPLPSGGTGFARSRRFIINDTVFNFLLLSPDNAQPFAYLTLGQRTLNRQVPLIVAIAQAQYFDPELYPGDVALVTEAVALPYPALYRNTNPLLGKKTGEPDEDKAEMYAAKPETVEHFSTLGSAVTLHHVWQKKIPTVRTGYAKHPTWRGGLEPWAPEQLAKLKDAGLSTISQTPVGVYEVQQICPASTVICFNMMRGAAGAASNLEWDRHKKTLLFPAMRLLTDIIADNSGSKLPIG